VLGELLKSFPHPKSKSSFQRTVKAIVEAAVRNTLTSEGDDLWQ
jgi:hypothetical protein